jgi:LacI family transcriptional regulator
LNINELARRLNLSISTVSRALNDAPDVSRETRERVKEVAAQYGYRANRLGRRLRRGKPETIGFLLTPPQRQFADPLYLEAIAGANEALNAYDLELSVTLARSQEDEIETLRRMVEAKAVDGILLARTRRDDKRIEYLLEKGIAFASWGRSTGSLPFPYIDGDYEFSGLTATRRLIQRGHRRVALLAPPRAFMFSHLQYSGYLAAHREADLAVDPLLAPETSFNPEEAAAKGYELLGLSDPPTAFVCSNDAMALSVCEAARQRNLRPGRDVAVIGWGNDPILGLVQPRLTTFQMDVRAAGRRLAEALVRYMESSFAEVQQVIWKPTLVEGESDPPLKGLAAPAKRRPSSTVSGNVSGE